MKKSYSIKGMHCASCAVNLTNALEQTNGISSASVNYATGKAHVEFDGIPESKIRKVVKELGFEAHEVEDITEHDAPSGMVVKLIVGVVCSVMIVLSRFFPYSDLVAFGLATVVQFYLGMLYYTGSYYALKNRTVNMDVLIALGTTAAYVFSISGLFVRTEVGLYFETSAMILTLVTVGKYIEWRAKNRSSRAIRDLMDLAPEQARMLKDGKEKMVPVDDVQVDDMLLVKPGERVPVDGIIIDGGAAVDESMISGESIPVHRKKGDQVIGSTICQNGAIRIKANRVGKDTTLAQIIALIEGSLETKGSVQRFADKVASYFVPVVLGVALITAMTWFFVSGSPSFAVVTSVSVLVIACPCALGLATPTAIMVGMGLGAQKGILIRNPDAIERAGGIRTMIFDKTGTITKGTPEVMHVESVKKGVTDVLRIAASLEENSEHPLAAAIIRKAKDKGIHTLAVTDFYAMSGEGISAKIDGKQYYLGTSDLMAKVDISVSGIGDSVKKHTAKGETLVYLADMRDILGFITVADDIKDSAYRAIRNIKRLGIQPVLLTGDGEASARAMAKRIGITEFKARVTPQEKGAYVRERRRDGTTAMVGDGINDAPALAEADIGIAVASGSDITKESGDIVLMKDDLNTVVDAVRLSRLTLRKVKENMFWALFYNTVGIPIAAGVLFPVTGWLLNPVIAGAAMAFSSISVVTNALLLRNTTF